MRAVLGAVKRKWFVVGRVIMPKYIATVQVHVRSIHAAVEHADGDVGIAIESQLVFRKARRPDRPHPTVTRGLIQMQHSGLIFFDLHKRISHELGQCADFSQR